MKLTEAIDYGARILKKNCIDNPRQDSELLICFCLNIPKVNLFKDPDKKINPNTMLKFNKLLKRRAKHEPLHYILGIREFLCLPFQVNSSVLIPRPETEFLIQNFVEILKENEIKNVLDIGTGSGNIAISLAINTVGVRIEAVDISKDALKTAKKNASLNGVSHRINFINSNLFSKIKITYDAIISNPPYISEKEFITLDEGITKYEPKIALKGGKQGLDFYKKITGEAKKYLNKGGWIFYEIGKGQCDQVKSILIKHDFYIHRVIKDYAGIERVIIGRLNWL